MSKIVIISSLFPPEPVVSAYLSFDLAESLSENNEVTVLCPRPTRPNGYKFEKRESTSKYEIIQLDSFAYPNSKILGRFRESYNFGKHCEKYIFNNSDQIDCIYLNTWPLFAQYFIVKTAKKFDIPCVTHIQDIYPESLTNKLPICIRNLFLNIFLPLDRYILNNSKKIIGISQNMINYLSSSRKIDINKFELVRNWQEDELFLDFVPTYSNRDDFVYLYLGSISKSAGVETLIYSFNKANLGNAKLIIAGSGSEKDKCINIARRLRNPNISFCDVSPKDVPEIQSKSDILLLPLKKGIANTATPSKLTAYLLSGKPVIACVEEQSDVANINKTFNCGLVAEPENVDIIALNMEKIYKMEKNNIINMGANGKKFAILNLSKKVNLKKLIFVIENSINRI